MSRLDLWHGKEGGPTHTHAQTYKKANTENSAECPKLTVNSIIATQTTKFNNELNKSENECERCGEIGNGNERMKYGKLII